MDHGDVVPVSGISEEDESPETAQYIQMNWIRQLEGKLSVQTMCFGC